MDEMQEDYPRPLHNRPHRGMDQAVFGVDMIVEFILLGLVVAVEVYILILVWRTDPATLP
jgi:hypothetical protein